MNRLISLQVSQCQLAPGNFLFEGISLCFASSVPEDVRCRVTVVMGQSGTAGTSAVLSTPPSPDDQRFLIQLLFGVPGYSKWLCPFVLKGLKAAQRKPLSY